MAAGLDAATPARRSDRDPDPADARHWAQARTLRDLGVLTARWMEGDITYQPGYGAAGPDEETDDLIPFLSAANRAGFVTTFSQPGQPAEDGWCQRATVEGFCDVKLATRLVDGLAGTDLVVLAHFPDCTGEVRVPVTLNGGSAYTWLPNPLDAVAFDQCYGESCRPEALDARCRARHVCVFDPVWGRNDVLWSELRRVMAIGGA
jgi:hypothetical protein